jgi:peptidoglycan/LPS O-acetylase OafA/YrhL
VDHRAASGTLLNGTTCIAVRSPAVAIKLPYLRLPRAIAGCEARRFFFQRISMTSTAASASPSLPGLDLLRAIAIVWVMLFHSFLVGGLGDNFAWLSRYGWMGVDIFFVLSGFLIGVQLLRQLQRNEPLRLGTFYARRAWRILPAFAVVLTVYACFPAWREEPGLQSWWQFATFTMNLLVDYTHNQAFSHAWSLCVEEHFYLVFPLLAWWLSRNRSSANFIAVCVLLVVAGVALRSAVWLHDAQLDSSRNWFIEDIYYPTWMRLDGLLIGVMLATLRVYRPHVWSYWQRHANSLLLAGCAVIACAFWLFRERTGLLGNSIGWPVLSLGFGLLVFSAADHHSVIGGRRIPAAGWIATISYSLYLSHKLAMHAVQGWLATFPSLPAGVIFFFYAAVIVLVGATLHYAVERPCLRWRDRAGVGNRWDRPPLISASEA